MEGMNRDVAPWWKELVPNKDKLDSEVFDYVAGYGFPLSFGVVEKAIETKYPHLCGSVLVRQSLWRLIESRKLELTGDSKVKERS